MKTTSSASRLIILFNFVVMILVWGSFPVAAKIGVEHAPPLLLSGLRFSLAFCILASIVLIQRKKLAITWQQHAQVCAISLLMVGIPGSIFFAATPYAPVGVLTVMWSTTPIFTSIFTLRDAGEVHGWKLLASLAIGLLGVLIVLLGRFPLLPGSNGGSQLFASSGSALTGELAVLGSAVIYGLGIRMAKHSGPDIPVLVLTTWQVFYSGAFLLAMSLLFERGYPFDPTLTTFGALLYLAIFCSCISFFLTFWLIRHIGAIRTAYGDFIIPGVTLVLSYFLLGESLTLAKIIGLALVILGVILVEM
ncbi:MAG TPA: EamA family transporter [Ktedonobacteraceae bacterium]|nr:EamA family transporter [Ktedonobacteraceae bacterium]